MHLLLWALLHLAAAVAADLAQQDLIRGAPVDRAVAAVAQMAGKHRASAAPEHLVRVFLAAMDRQLIQLTLVAGAADQAQSGQTHLAELLVLAVREHHRL